jgi:KDO2-lipid IV(A) lauroyltransferase
VRDDRFDALVVGFRTATGTEVIARDDPHFVSAVGSALQRNRLVALLIDQDIQGPGAGVFVPFFGRPAHTPPGAALLALRRRVPVVTGFIARRPGGHVARFAPMPTDVVRGAEGVRELTARLTAAIEEQIRRAPTEWVWWHQRWRRQPGAARPPRSAPALDDAAAAS